MNIFNMRDPANTEIPRDLKFVVPQIPRLNSGCGIGSPQPQKQVVYRLKLGGSSTVAIELASISTTAW